jgi:hypothetical protein
MNGQEPYGWLDLGATSTFVNPTDKRHLASTGVPSNKQVRLPNGKMERAGEQMTTPNCLCSPENAAISLPSLKTTLISNSKLAGAGYVTVYDGEEVNVYDGKTTQVVPTKQAVMTGWRDKLTGLWRFPLGAQVENTAMDTKLLSAAETNAIVDEVASNVHDLPSTE